MFTNAPRVKNAIDDFEITPREIARRQNAADYYLDFVRKDAAKARAKLPQPKMITPNYNISRPKERCVKLLHTKNETFQEVPFIPLTPQQLFNITISPRNRTVEKVLNELLIKRKF